MSRPALTSPVTKALWSGAAGICSFRHEGKACDERLYVEGNHIKGTVIGEAAHIIGYGCDGPRRKSKMSRKIINAESNLILLCPKHHTLVDRNERVFTVKVLREMKQQHLAWIREQLKPPGPPASAAPTLLARFHINRHGRPRTSDGYFEISLWFSGLPVDVRHIRYKLHSTYSPRRQWGSSGLHSLRIWSYGDFVVRSRIKCANGSSMFDRTMLSTSLKRGFVCSTDEAQNQRYQAAIEKLMKW